LIFWNHKQIQSTFRIPLLGNWSLYLQCNFVLRKKWWYMGNFRFWVNKTLPVLLSSLLVTSEMRLDQNLPQQNGPNLFAFCSKTSWTRSWDCKHLFDKGKNSRFMQVVTYFKHKEHSNNSFLNIKCVEVGLYTIL